MSIFFHFRILKMIFCQDNEKPFFLYSVYAVPKALSRYRSSCKICRCSITIANVEKPRVSRFPYINSTPMKSTPRNAGLQL